MKVPLHTIFLISDVFYTEFTTKQFHNEVSRVTFWGVNDGQTWLNDWPIKGRTNYPLLFDRNNQPKKAFYEILDLTK